MQSEARAFPTLKEAIRVATTEHSIDYYHKNRIFVAVHRVPGKSTWMMMTFSFGDPPVVTDEQYEHYEPVWEVVAYFHRDRWTWTCLFPNEDMGELPK